jgi:hypothetical protein
MELCEPVIMMVGYDKPLKSKNGRTTLLRRLFSSCLSGGNPLQLPPERDYEIGLEYW